MPSPTNSLKSLPSNLTKIRKRAGLTQRQLEDALEIGPGWVGLFETGVIVPSMEMLLAILCKTKAGLADLLGNSPQQETVGIKRNIFAKQDEEHLIVNFSYSRYDAEYKLSNGKLKDFDSVIKTMRDGLARLDSPEDKEETIKSRAVEDAFMKAITLWPKANPSDLWWFIIYRAYCDPYNHPGKFARMNFTESWKRTGGWALERILVRHYSGFLKQKGIHLFIADAPAKQRLIKSLTVAGQIVPDKVDVVLTGDTPDGEKMFGVVHVKASFAERRTDDVPMSEILTKEGYTSPLWTMDCKSTPSAHPVNRGELGKNAGKLSEKRSDIEHGGKFTGCFSYNTNTLPTIGDLPAEQRIHVCNFQNPDDEFSKFIIARWKTFRNS